MTNATAQLFRNAADIIEKRGWTQGAYMGFEVNPAEESTYETCSVCAQAALNVASGEVPDMESPESLDASIAFTDWRVEPEDVPYLSLIDWNDDPDRTAEEVVATFRAYADHLDAAA